MNRSILTTWALLRKTIDECQKDNTPMIAAALAFYSMLSMAPTLLVAVAVAGMWFGKESARAQVETTAYQMLGANGAQLVMGALEKVQARSSTLTLIGLASMLFGATIAFSALQDALNRIWDVPPKPRGMVWGFVLKRLVSFGMMLVVGGLLFSSLILSAVISGAETLVPEWLPGSELLLQVVNFVVSVGLMTLLFGMIYKWLPDAVIEWRDVWVGATFTAFLFAAGKTLIGLYLGKASVGSAYAAASSLVVFLVWLYYSAQIFLVGAEFTEVYAHQHGKRITPLVELMKQ